MTDGIDRKAFSAEIKAMAPDARRSRMREFGLWVREASKASDWLSYLGLAFTGASIVIMGLSFALRPHIRALLPIAELVLIVGAGLNMLSARRARQWRRLHPFEAWRATR